MNTRRNASQRLIAALATVAVGLFGWAAAASGQDSPRARDLGVPFEGTPGPLNAITDVAGIEVGHHTIIRGEGELVVGEGPVRTGVTAVLPRGRASRGRVFAAWFTLNGNGEMTGTTWMRDRGILEGAVMITNTHSVGAVHEATIAWAQQNLDGAGLEPARRCRDLGRVPERHQRLHVRQEHVFAALDSARSGPVAEGSVGGGTGMRTFGFKAGIGTSSRIVEAGGNEYVGRCARAVEFRQPEPDDRRRGAGGAGDPGPHPGARAVRRPP